MTCVFFGKVHLWKYFNMMHDESNSLATSAYSASLWAGKPSGPRDVLAKSVFRVEYQQGWLGPPTLSSTNIHDDIAEQTCSDPLPFKNDGGQPVNLACVMVRATWLQFEAGVSWVHMYIYIYIARVLTFDWNQRKSMQDCSFVCVCVPSE